MDGKQRPQERLDTFFAAVAERLGWCKIGPDEHGAWGYRAEPERWGAGRPGTDEQLVRKEGFMICDPWIPLYPEPVILSWKGDTGEWSNNPSTWQLFDLVNGVSEGQLEQFAFSGPDKFLCDWIRLNAWVDKMTREVDRVSAKVYPMGME